MSRTYTLPLLAVCLSFAPIAAAAAVPTHRIDAVALGDPELATIFGTGGGLDRDLPVIVDEHRNFDRSIFTSGTSDSMDGWWAEVGLDLIAANLP